MTCTDPDFDAAFAAFATDYQAAAIAAAHPAAVQVRLAAEVEAEPELEAG